MCHFGAAERAAAGPRIAVNGTSARVPPCAQTSDAIMFIYRANIFLKL